MPRGKREHHLYERPVGNNPTVANWSQRGQTICRTRQFDGFVMSIAFVRRIAKRAEKLNHHPETQATIQAFLYRSS